MDINGRDYVPVELFCALYGRNGVFTALDGSYVLNTGLKFFFVFVLFPSGSESSVTLVKLDLK